MTVVRCENEHYYDDQKYQSCPHCVGGADQAEDDSFTIIASGTGNHFGLIEQSGSTITEKLAGLVEDEKTISFSHAHDFDPVVGWLVCVQGSEKGRDYRIHSGQNFIGRSLVSDLIIANDAQVSRKNHCIIIYDPKLNQFYLTPGEGVGVWLNNCLLKASTQIKDLDRINLGGSEFVFIALCKEAFQW